MKKILIATTCIFALCLTSCASDQPPETEVQAEAPNVENTDDTTEADSQTNEESKQESSEEENSTDTDNSEEDESLTSEDFPEPEEIEEQEIITLEPVEEIPEEETPAPIEPVEKEEPPAISETPLQSEPETKEPEPQEQEQNTSENDVIIDSSQDSDGISGGIDITDDDTDSNTETTGPEKEIIPSRSVTLKKFEYLDVTYPGTGWIYMGLTDNSKDIAYFGRKLGTKDTKFSLQARTAGTKIIHFYRNDPLTGQYLDDYIEVIITAENGSNKTHVAAPDYKLPVQKKEKPVKKVEEVSEEPETTQIAAPAKQPSETRPSETKPAAETPDPVLPEKHLGKQPEKKTEDSSSNGITVPAESTSNPDSLLQEAQLLYNEKEYKAAISKLNQFFEYSTDNRDEALYLKGQILEAKSDVRDIKGAIDAYTTLTKNYPASKFWDSANKRIIYLKRFYLEVR